MFNTKEYTMMTNHKTRSVRANGIPFKLSILKKVPYTR